jgi:hypothetical protein
METSNSLIASYKIKIENQDSLISQCRGMISISRGNKGEVAEYKNELSVLRAVRQNYIQFIKDLENL